MQLGQGMDGAGQTLPPWAAVKHSRRAPGRACCVNVMGAQGRWNRTAAHALRQGFCLRQKRLNGAYRAAPSQMGPQWPTARQETDVFLLVAYTLPNHGVGRPKTRGVLETLRVGPARAE